MTAGSTQAGLRSRPFVGRASELALLDELYRGARGGSGAVVTVVGEPGIGKTRLAEEFCTRAERAGATVLAGGCYEDGSPSPYAPFAEAVDAWVRHAAPDTLRGALGEWVAPLARLVPSLRSGAPGLPEPVALAPEEERQRLLDVMSRWLLARCEEGPVVLLVEDLHWADAGTLALFRWLARLAARHRLLLIGTYREADVEGRTALVDALVALRREARLERIVLKRLTRLEVAAFIEGMTAQPPSAAFVDTVAGATGGNPFFVHEVLLDLADRGHTGAPPLAAPDATVPDGVRHLAMQRLGRVSAAGQTLLRAAAAFPSGFRLAVAAAAAGLDGATAVAALEEALAARLVRPRREPDQFEFEHALLQRAVYTEVNPVRQQRLHRAIAEVLERPEHAAYDDQAAQLAHHYHHSATLPGADRGAAHALAAAGRAASMGAHEEVVRLLRIALDLLPAADARRPRALARLSLAQIWTGEADAAIESACAAAALLAAGEGPAAAARHLADATFDLGRAGCLRAAGELAARGLELAGERRDAPWVWLMAYDLLRRQAERPGQPGLMVESAECDAVRAVASRLELTPWQRLALMLFGLIAPAGATGVAHAAEGSSYGALASLWEQTALHAEHTGQPLLRALSWAESARMSAAAGRFGEVSAAARRAGGVESVPGRLSSHALLLGSLQLETVLALGEGGEELLGGMTVALAAPPAESAWMRASVLAAQARLLAMLGQGDAARASVVAVLPALEHGSPFTILYRAAACDAVDALWRLGAGEHAAALEACVRGKAFTCDYPWPMRDPHLAMAQLCALQGLGPEATEWFARARRVLEAQGARPLLAIVDHDEGVACLGCDAGRARQLLESALAQFRALGMTGWVRRAETVLAQACGAGGEAAADLRVSVFRLEGDHVVISHDDLSVRLRNSLGMRYLAFLLARPDERFHARELMAATGRLLPSGEKRVAAGGDVGPARGGVASDAVVDARAREEYRRHLADLQEELAEAEQCNDAGRVERLRGEIDALTEHLAHAFGLGRRARAFASDGDRIRQAVTKRVKAAVQQIGESHPSLGRHLARSIKTGFLCGYLPDRGDAVRWRS